MKEEAKPEFVTGWQSMYKSTVWIPLTDEELKENYGRVTLMTYKSLSPS